MRHRATRCLRGPAAGLEPSVPRAKVDCGAPDAELEPLEMGNMSLFWPVDPTQLPKELSGRAWPPKSAKADAKKGENGILCFSFCVRLCAFLRPNSLGFEGGVDCGFGALGPLRYLPGSVWWEKGGLTRRFFFNVRQKDYDRNRKFAKCVDPLFYV